MPEVGEEDDLDGESDEEEELSSAQQPKKRKSWSEEEDSDEVMSDDERPRQRRRSNSVCMAGSEAGHNLTTTGRLNTLIARTKTGKKRLGHREPTRRLLRLLTI